MSDLRAEQLRSQRSGTALYLVHEPSHVQRRDNHHWPALKERRRGGVMLMCHDASLLQAKVNETPTQTLDLVAPEALRAIAQEEST